MRTETDGHARHFTPFAKIFIRFIESYKFVLNMSKYNRWLLNLYSLGEYLLQYSITLNL